LCDDLAHRLIIEMLIGKQINCTPLPPDAAASFWQPSPSLTSGLVPARPKSFRSFAAVVMSEPLRSPPGPIMLWTGSNSIAPSASRCCPSA
jgi:hypothetical protein